MAEINLERQVKTKAIKNYDYLKRKKERKLSNDELQKRITRLSMEKKYKDLKRDLGYDGAVSKGIRAATTGLKVLGGLAGFTGLSLTLYNNTNKIADILGGKK